MCTVYVPPRLVARIAGWSYLGIFVLALFANFLVRENLIDPGDAAATASNISGSETLFRSGLAALVVVCVLDLVVAWALHVLLRQVRADVSLLAAWFRLAYAVLLGASSAAFFVVLELVTDAGYAASLGAEQRDAHVQLFAAAFEAAWLVGLALFGLHLVLVGSLAWRSGAMPRALGVALVVAGSGYVIDTFAHALLARYDDFEAVFLAVYAVPSIIGELWLALWLLLRGSAAPDARPEASPVATVRS